MRTPKNLSQKTKFKLWIGRLDNSACNNFKFDNADTKELAEKKTKFKLCIECLDHNACNNFELANADTK